MPSSQIICIHCGCCEGVVRWGESKQKKARYRCSSCKKTFCSRTRTLRYKTRLNEKQWKMVPELLCLRTHPSGADLGRLLGTSIRTGQRIMQKTRSLLPSAAPPTPRVKTIAELDETTFNGKWIGGAKQRHGPLSLMPLQNRGTQVMNSFVDALVSEETTVLTDEWRGYNEVRLKRKHFTVCHAREFVSPHSNLIHTNSIEGVWGHAKPLAIHTYRGYPRIPDFLKEICFQFNSNYSERRSYLKAHFSRPLIPTNTLCP